jgi:hypothetical protein
MSQPSHDAAAFISYSRADTEFALRLAQDLKAAGAQVWLDQLDIHAGHEWDNAIEAALVEAPQMLLVLSPDSASSRNVRNEVALALDEGKVILPILHRDCTIPLQLRRLQYIDFRTDYARGLSLLLSHMKVQPSTESVPASAVAPPSAQPAPKARPAPSSPATPPAANEPQPLPPSPAHSHSGEHWVLRRLRQFWPLIPLLAILIALMLSDLGDFMGYNPFASDPCSLGEIDQSSLSAKLYLPLARWALRYTPTPSVAIIYIDPSHDPPDLLTNTCASRAFLARLVAALNTLSAHVIVIDKYYSANACAEQDKNAAFVSAMEGSKVPIVVGQQTYALGDGSNSPGCLALTPRLQFSSASKVLYGLTRLNSDDLKIPMRWPVFNQPPAPPPAARQPNPPAPPPTQLPASSGDTLSLVAAKAVNPHLESNRSVGKLLAEQVHPYTTFLNLPHITALTALCSAEPAPRAPIDGQPGDALCQPWVRPVDNLDGNQLSLDSKIVVIGEITELDMHPFPTTLPPFPVNQRPGVFLQANYIQALLDHRFLQEIPLWLTVAGLVVFVIGVYCLYWSHDKEGKPHLSAERAGIASLVVFAAMVLTSMLAVLSMSYFTPLWALWGAGAFVVFRYLEASGHHRSQHLLAHLTGHHHAEEHPPAQTPPSH